MSPSLPHVPKLLRWSLLAAVAALCLSVLGCAHVAEALKPAPNPKEVRAQLSIGYSLLYQEAEGIPKLKWLLAFKDKSSQMSKVTEALTEYYRNLAGRMQALAKTHPAMRLDATTMSDIESDTRKAIGEDTAKDMAPLVGKSGIAFEREALLTFYNALNEQRHLVGVMIEKEKDPALLKFLQSTKTELDDHHEKVGKLLDEKYFVH